MPGEQATVDRVLGFGKRAFGVGAESRERIYAVVALVPRGKVTTYGAVAKLAGLSGQARQVGYALSALPDARLPWQRVVNAAGRISFPPGSELGELQRGLLEDEGIIFDASGRIDLERFGWKPTAPFRSGI